MFQKSVNDQILFVTPTAALKTYFSISKSTYRKGFPEKEKTDRNAKKFLWNFETAGSQ